MSKPVLVAFASGSDDLIPSLLDGLTKLAPDLELFVVAEFAPPYGRWIQYHVSRTLRQNLDHLRSILAGKKIHLAGVILQPNMPYWRMRLMPLLIAPHRTLFYNENLDHFMLRPRSLPVIARHLLWRAGNMVRWQLKPGGKVYTFLWRLVHPRAFVRPALLRWARLAGLCIYIRKLLPARREVSDASASLPQGISVVIPSRNGLELLERLLPGLLRELEGIDSEVLIVDNGSSDSTAQSIRAVYPSCEVIEEPAALSFARAVNRGIAKARYSHTLLLNNDMELLPGFFAPLCKAFLQVPALFCATAQIYFPEGQRRQETGKAVMPPLPPARKDDSFPLTCLVPIDGEDGTYVMYGSGGCSLYETRKLRTLGCVGEIYEPAYVEDLDLGYRAWRRGWPTVFVAGARLVHRHRSTTSRYYSEAQLGLALELNYLKFLARAVSYPRVFRRLWHDALERLNLLVIADKSYARQTLKRSFEAIRAGERQFAGAMSDEEVLAVGSGEIAVFPGRDGRGFPVVVIASPYIPFPLSHGGAVRMFNLMREASREFDLVLVTFMEKLETPPAELLALCSEVVEVRRLGSHSRPLTGRPDTVEDFDRPSFHAALKQTVRKWNAAVVQLEFTQMALYRNSAAPAPTILVEHDITVDLYEQLLQQKGSDWEIEQQLERWRSFEAEAWNDVDCVVTMSRRDQQRVQGAKQVTAIANGVDLKRFQVSSTEPEPRRLLFLGSFAHLPNVLAVDYFLREVWPLLDPKPALHVIAGKNHQYFLDRYKDQAAPELHQPNVEIEDFVADVRPAYRRATLVIAPLLASAGTNIKIMEAMAMGKAVVSTPGGVNGLDEVTSGHDVIVTASPSEMAAAIERLLQHPQERRRIEENARATAERVYGWSAIGEEQSRLYRQLTGRPLT